jgi:hypothetical protein
MKTETLLEKLRLFAQTSSVFIRCYPITRTIQLIFSSSKEKERAAVNVNGHSVHFLSFLGLQKTGPDDSWTVPKTYDFKMICVLVSSYLFDQELQVETQFAPDSHSITWNWVDCTIYFRIKYNLRVIQYDPFEKTLTVKKDDVLLEKCHRSWTNNDFIQDIVSLLKSGENLQEHGWITKEKENV